MPTQPSKNLDTFPNPHPDRDYIIEIECPEFTCLCPRTGQPDFASLALEYVPDRLCVELKSLKLYIWSYRNEGHFHEDVTNRILNDLVAVMHPRYLRLRAKFNVRGGLYTTIEVVHRQSGWEAQPPPPADLPREIQELPARDPPAAAPTKAPAAKAMPASKTRNPVRLTEPVTPAAPAAPASDRFRMLQRTRRQEQMPEKAGDDQTEEVRDSVDEPAEPPPSPRQDGLYIGIDLGTSGCRVMAVDASGTLQGEISVPIPTPPRNEDEVTQDPTVWWKAVSGCLQNLLEQIDPQRVQALAVDGTSGTLLLCDAKGSPVTPAIMYSDRRAVEQAKKIASLASDDSGAQGAGSSLAKLLWLHERKLDKRARHALHQADWISGRLTGQYGHSDYNNCLKLGFDAGKMAWPKWLNKLGFNAALLPEVHAPGETLGTISADTAKTFGLPADVQVLAGTTDGVAAFLAAGGASNSGGAVLLQYFKIEQMREMTPLLDPENPTGLDYYPLPEIGERFPINNPEMAPRLEPLPGDSIIFFQGMLEGIARIEAQGYALLEKLGAPPLAKVCTTGGGSQNPAWGRIREKILRAKMEKPRSEHAAYGSALLAAGIVTKTFS